MKQRVLITATAAVLLLGGMLFMLHRQGPDHVHPAGTLNPSAGGDVRPPPGAARSAETRPSATGPTAPAVSALPQQSATTGPRPSATPAVLGFIPQTNRAPLPPGPPAPQGSNAIALQDLEKINRMLRDYRTVIGDNPVGTNAEIMKAIMGGNPKKANLGPPPGMSLNGNGELVDPWGTPFFFHQLSGTQMEIRSAGPDLKMWTGDDIVNK